MYGYYIPFTFTLFINPYPFSYSLPIPLAITTIPKTRNPSLLIGLSRGRERARDGKMGEGGWRGSKGWGKELGKEGKRDAHILQKAKGERRTILEGYRK